MDRWLERIESTDTVYEMETLFDEIALDSSITNKEYEELYIVALNRVR